jgi:hypothetical protein
MEQISVELTFYIHKNMSLHKILNTVWISKTIRLSVISDFRRDADDICALLEYYAASRGNPLPTFRDNVSSLFSKVKTSKKKSLENGTDTLS